MSILAFVKLLHCVFILIHIFGILFNLLLANFLGVPFQKMKVIYDISFHMDIFF